MNLDTVRFKNKKVLSMLLNIFETNLSKNEDNEEGVGIGRNIF